MCSGAWSPRPSATHQPGVSLCSQLRFCSRAQAPGLAQRGSVTLTGSHGLFSLSQRCPLPCHLPLPPPAALHLTAGPCQQVTDILLSNICLIFSKNMPRAESVCEMYWNPATPLQTQAAPHPRAPPPQYGTPFQELPSALFSISKPPWGRRSWNHRPPAGPPPQRGLQGLCSPCSLWEHLQTRCWGRHTDWNRPPWPGPTVTIRTSCFMTGPPGKEYGTDKPPPIRRARERPTEDTARPSTSQNPSC